MAKLKKLPIVILALVILLLGGSLVLITKPKNVYLVFTTEVWQTIQENYWDKISDNQLAALFKAANEKLTDQPTNLKRNTEKEVIKMTAATLKTLKEPEKKKEYVAQMADLVLANLAPFSRSRLYTRKEEKALTDNVNNISGIDQYQVLEIPKEASTEAIQKAFEQKKAELRPEADQSPEAAQNLAQVEQAYQVLGEAANRQVYDQSGVEPTMNWRSLNPDIFYLKLSKFSPTTLDELQRTAARSDQWPDASTLILDLRDNVGGAFDGLPWFLGPFIGADQYAYHLWHQGEITDYKTKIGWLPSLVKFKKLVVLINENTQSTAEVMAATIKKYNVGVLVGATTKGWGTIERVFEIKQQLSAEEKFSIFLVHSLTLREDNQPIQDKGVEPTVSLQSPTWEKELYNYFRYPELISAVKELTS